MFIKRIIAAAVVAVVSSAVATAQPTASLTGVAGSTSGTFDWTLSFTPDSTPGTFFIDIPNDTPNKGVGGSLATEFKIEVPDGGFSNVMVNTNFMETINTVLIENPGNNPYTGTETTGWSTHDNVTSDLGLSGTPDALFLPLGSTFFNTGGAKTAVTFTTTSNTATFGGLIAQDNHNGNNMDDVYTIAAMNAMATGGLLFGDATNDGAVTGADLTAVTTEFGKTGPADGLLLGDATDDGAVTGADLTAVTTEFGKTLGSGAFTTAAATVPEPSAVVSLLCGLGAFTLLRRR